MDTRPIGVFDSGLGGLTAVRTLWDLLPQEELVYFGDTARVPYGTRSRETILQYARQDVRFLRTFQPKALVVACGTISTTSLAELSAETPVPVVGVVEPACQEAAERTHSGRIGVIATPASIRSGAYGAALRRLTPGVEVTERACPLFVPLVENGRFQRGDVVIETVAREYLAPLREAGIDTLILGCTHYPLLREVIAEIMEGSVALISAGEAAVRELKRLLEARGLLRESDFPGETRFYVSDRTEGFEASASAFLQEDLRHTARRIDIEQY